MKKHFIFFFLLLCRFFDLFGQNPGQLPISVSANEYTTVSIFFPASIAKVIEPSVNYKFDYELGTTMGFLKARKGNPSNLTVITEEGHIYSFALQYAENIDNYNYVINFEQAVGKTKHTPDRINKSQNTTLPKNNSHEPKDVIENPVNKDVDQASTMKGISLDDSTEDLIDNLGNTTEKTLNIADIEAKEGDLYELDKEEYYRIFCENNYLQRTIFKRSFRQSKRVVLKLNNILIDRNEIYFVLQIENNSKKEYMVNGLSFFLKRDGSEVQKIMPPLYKFNLQKIIDPESVNEVVYVFNKFSLKSKEEVFVVLDELESNRMVLLPLDNKEINSPTN